MNDTITFSRVCTVIRNGETTRDGFYDSRQWTFRITECKEAISIPVVMGLEFYALDNHWVFLYDRNDCGCRTEFKHNRKLLDLVPAPPMEEEIAGGFDETAHEERETLEEFKKKWRVDGHRIIFQYLENGEVRAIADSRVIDRWIPPRETDHSWQADAAPEKPSIVVSNNTDHEKWRRWAENQIYSLQSQLDVANKRIEILGAKSTRDLP